MPEEETKPKRKGRKPRGVSMNRCSQCGKFVSMEPGEPEDQGLTLSVEPVNGENQHEIMLGGDVRVTLNCADCSSELAETTLTFEENWNLDHEEGCEKSADMETQGPDIEADENSEGSGMYTKRFYGATVRLKVSCPECKVTVEESSSQFEQASSFEITG